MVRMTGFAAGMLLVATLASCTGKTPVPPDKKDYVGSWKGENGSRMTILSDGGCDFEQKKGNTTTSMNGGGVHWEGSKLIVKMGVSAEFVIDQPPTQVDGKWTMKLDGERFERQ